MIGRSSTGGGLLAYGLLTLVGLCVVGYVCIEIIAPIVRYLMPGVEL